MSVSGSHGPPGSGPQWRVGEVVDGRYHVTSVLGRGGMGEVYLVRHLEWGTDLAVKCPQARLFREQRQRELFVAEAQTWVSLGLHPHVCGCHYVQEIDGVLRVFAEYVPGGSLHDLIDGGGLYRGAPAEVTLRVLDLAVQAARGLAHAHRRGVAHLDVKPANILIERDGTAKITDFGLARARAALEAPDPGAPGRPGAQGTRGAQGPPGDQGAQFTNPGVMTRGYASPEQSGRRRVGQPSDVYSLAVTVLEMFLRGRTWMLGDAAPAALAEGRAGVPEDVAALLEHCFADDPGARPTMEEAASGLVAIYRAHSGSPYPRPEPTPASLLADELNNRALSLLDLGRQAEADAAFTRALAVDPRHLEAGFNRSVQRWRRGEITDLAVLGAVEAARSGGDDPGRADYLLAGVHLERGDLASATALLGRTAAELPDAARMLRDLPDPDHAPPAPRLDAQFSRLPARLSPDGRRVLTGSAEGGLRLWDLPGARLLARLVAPDAGPAHSVDLGADGRFALSAHDGVLRYWDLGRRRCVGTVASNAEEPRLALDDRVAAWALPGGAIRFWDPAGGTLSDTDEGHAEGADRLEPGPGGRVALSGGWEPGGAAVRLWDLGTRRCLRVFAEGDASVTALRFGPAGRLVAVARSDATIELWDPRRPARIRVLRRAVGAHLAFDPTGRFLLSGDEADTVQLWEVESGRLLRTFDDVAQVLSGLHPTAGARTIRAVTSRRRQEMHVTVLRPGLGYRSRSALSRPRGQQELTELRSRVRTLVGDARRAVESGAYGAALELLEAARAVPGHLRDPEVLDAWRALGRHTGRTGVRGGWQARAMTGHRAAVHSVDLSADGRFAVSGDRDGTVRLWDTATGRCVRRFDAHSPHLVGAVRFSPDGSTVATSARGAVRLWRTDPDLEPDSDTGTDPNPDPDPGAPLRTLPAFGLHDLVPLDFTPDGRRILVGGGDGTLRVWDLASGEPVADLAGHRGAVLDVRVAADGRRAVSAGADRTVRIWDLDRGVCADVFAGHGGAVCSVALGPDGRTAVSHAGPFKGEIQAWALASPSGARRYAEPPDGTIGVRFLGDGRFALSAAGTGSLTVWDTAEGTRVRAVRAGPSASATAFAVSADGDFALTGGGDVVRLWHLDWELRDGEPRDGLS
ncbi:protein kinase [Kitasatospora sp. NPDC056446]|uniref:protein kinase domain-containing protein n=1 Tax=Kitasatospora sp. NPDC056446 TaxID=3345819 RepID=UPI0036A164BB